MYVNTTVPYFGKNMQKENLCPICGTSRWVDDNSKVKKVSHKVLRYFPLTHQLKHLYSCRHTVKEMRWHCIDWPNEEGVWCHPANGKVWKDFDCSFPTFTKELRNVWLRLMIDGFNPFGNMSLSYSMWPMILTAYNLPSWLCMKDSYFMLILLILGPQAHGKIWTYFWGHRLMSWKSYRC